MAETKIWHATPFECSGKQEPAFGLRNRASEFPGGFQPLVDHSFDIGQRFLPGSAIGGAAGQFRYFGDEGVIFVAPIQNDFVFCSCIPIREFILNQNLTYLFHLVRFSQGVLWLKIENLRDESMGEDVVTTPDSLSEAKSQKKAAQVTKANVRVRRATQHLHENGISHTRLCT